MSSSSRLPNGFASTSFSTAAPSSVPSSVPAGTTTAAAGSEHRRVRFPSGADARLSVEAREDDCPGPVGPPAAELRPHPRPRREVRREHPPPAISAGDVEHRIDYAAQVIRVRTSPLRLLQQELAHALPLVVGEVGRVRHGSQGARRSPRSNLRSRIGTHPIRTAASGRSRISCQESPRGGLEPTG